LAHGTFGGGSNWKGVISILNKNGCPHLDVEDALQLAAQRNLHWGGPSAVPNACSDHSVTFAIKRDPRLIQSLSMSPF
jgi:hypothetical protein